MSQPKLQIRKRNLPHWTLEGSTYFVTFRVRKGTLSPAERRIVLGHIKAGDSRFYQLAAVVVMPDHVHLLLRPLTGYSLSRIMKGIKGVSAKLINAARGDSGRIWQDESWDRIIRDAGEFDEKLQYMAENPVRAGLIGPDEEYDGWYRSPDV